MENGKNYNIGLDIGVGSVGWCVTNQDGDIIRRKGKNMWGSRIFNEAQTAKETRIFRASKRRINRRRERINILQSLIMSEMESEYPNFFQMLRESSLDFEDKTKAEKILGTKYNLFSDSQMTDQLYYGQFPTIYHLRNYLVNTNEKVDIRLVYLAIHHIIKYRGNFLYEGDFSENTNQISKNIDIILEYLSNNFDIILKENKQKIFDILSERSISKSNKKELIINCFEFDKEGKQTVTNIVNSFLGYTFDLSKIFEINIEKTKISFSNELDNEEEIKEQLQENTEVFEQMEAVYSWYILQDILRGETYISQAFIEKYKKYEDDLKLLKDVYRKYFPQEYKEMFKTNGKNNYVAYTGKSQGKTYKKCKPEEFFSTLKKKIEELPDDIKEKNQITEDIENNNFLKKMNVTENGAIPHQLHQKELEIILENQSKYYKSIKENKENIIKLFYFRIPYYVGPLSKEKGKWSWIVRRSNEKIRPWNFEEVVDTDATAEEFIKRMTNKCTYILNEDVMPKQSLLYSKFCVLNELNNIRINGKRLSKNEKNIIVEKAFKTNKKVTRTKVENLLKLEGITVKTFEGLQDNKNFMSNMSSYIDMKKILGKVDENNFEQCEKLIYWITIFEEKKILKRKIKKEYPELTDVQVNELVKLKYSGWSRLSKKLLTGLKAYDGENIMDKLEKTTQNFMQIINQKEYGFDKQLEKFMPNKTTKLTYEDVAEIPTSPSNKRAIWQSILVVREIAQIMKKEPSNIFIEFARAEDNKKTMKDNRVKQLMKKYEEIESQLKYLKNYDSKVYKELKKHQSDKTLNEKMYLYYIQNGKCLYSGKPLNIDELSLYEVDHIIPQSYIKDDSIDNKALVIKEENQRKKDNLLLDDKIINSQIEWWKNLLETSLITQNKFYKLTRRKMFETDSEKEKFVQRQLVETRQITKHVTNLLKNQYTDTDIFAIRGELTHGFREKYKIYKNRNVNYYHHAQDAYILSIIATTLNKHWKGTEQFKYSEYVKKYIKDDKMKYEKNGIILGFINKHIDVEKIKKTMEYKDCYISRMLEENTGAFYDQTLYSPRENKTKLWTLKSNKPSEKYGGYSGTKIAYCAIYTYIDKKDKQQYELIGIPVQIAYKIKQGKEEIKNYVKNEYLKDKEYSNFKIIKEKILINQIYLDENNEPMRLCSDSEIRPSKELIVDYKMSELIHLMNTPEDKLNDEEIQKLEKSYINMFNYLINKLNNEYKIFTAIYLKLQNKIEDFEKLNKTDKKSVINGLISLMETGQGNLKAIGLTEREGRKSGQKFKTDKLLKMTFIDKSVTGMYERRYKINGLENSCSK